MFHVYFIIIFHFFDSKITEDSNSSPKQNGIKANEDKLERKKSESLGNCYWLVKNI